MHAKHNNILLQYAIIFFDEFGSLAEAFIIE